MGVPGGCWSNREQGARQREPGGARERQQGQRPPAQPGPPPRDEQGPGQGGAGQRHQEAQQRRAADRGPWCGRCARLAHRQPAPGERVRPPAAQRLGAHPPARHRQRPGAQVEQQPLAHGEYREDHRLGDRQREPRVPGHVDQPGQQRDEEGQPEHQAGQQRGAQAAPPQRHGQQRRAGRGERPDPDRREGGRQGQPAGQRHGQRPGQAQARGGVQAAWARAGRAGCGGPAGRGLRPGLRGGQSCRSRLAGGRGRRLGFLARSGYRLGTGRGEGAGLVLRAGGHARALTARAAGHRHRSSRLAAGPCLWAHTAACEGNRATGLPPPPSRLARNSRRRRRIARRGNAAGRSLADLRRLGPLVAPWCPSLVLGERSPR